MMKPGRVVLVLLPLLTACGSVRHWRELQTEPMTYGACYDGLVEVVTARDGFRTDSSASDRGLGTWQSTWRRRETERHFPIRTRLVCEIAIDEGSTEKGWLLRYRVERDTIKDLRRHREPREEDWSADGQDAEVESVLGERLVRRLAPNSVRLSAPQQDRTWQQRGT